jgi:hypothetical protein
VIGYFISREQSIGDLFRKSLAHVAGRKRRESDLGGFVI